MKIISWNCNGKFREKFQEIKKENSDIYVIQECENPQKHPGKFKGFYSDYQWFGEKESKGVAIFVKGGIKMELNDWPTYCLRHFLSVKINDKFDLVGVWASAPYIEEYYIYQSINYEKYTDKTILIGDFNSNAIWDKKHRKRNHSTVVEELGKKNIVSAYHYFTNEVQGKETEATFFLYRHKDRPYHIDYCFTNPENMAKFKILNDEKWISLSDHLPIQVDLNL